MISSPVVEVTSSVPLGRVWRSSAAYSFAGGAVDVGDAVGVNSFGVSCTSEGSANAFLRCVVEGVVEYS